MIYAGAIMVLFIFVIMMLNLGSEGASRERSWLEPRYWVLPSALSALLLLELVLAMESTAELGSAVVVDPKTVGLTLFGPYVLAVELASMLLMAGLVGAYHVGRRFIVRRGDGA